MLKKNIIAKNLEEKKKLTLLLVPHSGKTIHSVEINIYFLLFCTLVFISLIVYTLYSVFVSTNRNLDYRSNIQTLQEQNEEIELLAQEIEKTKHINNQFMSELDKTNKLVNFSINNKKQEQLLLGDLSQTLSFTERESRDIDGNVSLVLLQQNMSKSLPVLERANTILENQQNFLKDIPIYFPVKNAHVSMEWGPNIHPVFGYWYIHKGIDLAANPGTPVYAAADGVITYVNYDEGYGNHIYISHSFGFKTHYSHLKKIKVTKGELVSQGQMIGTVGSTGLVTGPHLDFQIYLGSELTDPGPYIRYLRKYPRPKGTR